MKTLPEAIMIPAVCAIIEDETGHFLLAKRPEGKCHGGFWEFPGGKLEEGESIEAALVRELQEELLIQTEVFQILEMVEHHYEKSSIRLIPCRARILSGIPTALEHSEIGWFSVHQIDRSSLAPADVPVLAMLTAP
jgi:8-oxo-dGTP diphosphatase